jgi:tight adherence protein B
MARDLREARKEKLIRSLTAGRSAGERSERMEETGRQGGWLRRNLPESVDLTSIEDLIRSAEAPLSLERFLMLSLVSGIVFLLAPLLLFPQPLVMMLAFAGGLALPLGVLRIMRSRREEAMVRQLPEAIDTIVRSLRAGQSVDAAILEVARGFPPPVGAEFRSIHEEMAMGLSFEAVLKSFQRRFPGLSDVRILCTTFVIQRETGGNLTEILAGLSRTIRERFRLKRQVKAATAEGRATALILGGMPLGFAVVTWIMKPDYVGVFLTHPMGRKLFMVVIFMELAGFILMRQLSRVKV